VAAQQYEFRIPVKIYNRVTNQPMQAIESNEQNQENTPFIPELGEAERRALQQKTAARYGLDNYFSDDMKDGGQGPALAVIPAGIFEMGSTPREFGHRSEEAPQHYVSIQHPYALGRYAVTAEEFERFREATQWHLRPELLWVKDQKPVMNIRIADARLFLKWLTEQTGHRYRLPTEAEWEYAARAGTTTPFHFGETVSCKEIHFDSTAPYNEAKENKKWFMPRCMPMPTSIDVGSKPANIWGLHEVHGNVWEFTDSPWTPSHVNANRDGSASPHNHSRWVVTKGGSWFDPAALARSAARKKRLNDEMDTNLGFRVLRELS
jgi:formylglycine-generating enzyme required for sulfatase activity